jgi:hypothetical protein
MTTLTRAGALLAKLNEAGNPDLYKDRPNQEGHTYYELPDHAQKAFDELAKLGAPIFMNDWGGYFNISAEYGRDWADYRQQSATSKLDKNGVSKKINKILKKHKLYTEWANSAVLQVLDI